MKKRFYVMIAALDVIGGNYEARFATCDALGYTHAGEPVLANYKHDDYDHPMRDVGPWNEVYVVVKSENGYDNGWRLIPNHEIEQPNGLIDYDQIVSKGYTPYEFHNDTLKSGEV